MSKQNPLLCETGMPFVINTPSFRKQNLESTIVCQVYHAMTYIYMCNRNQRNGDPRSAVCGRDLEVPRRRLDSPGYRATVPVFRNRILYKSLPG